MRFGRFGMRFGRFGRGSARFVRFGIGSVENGRGGGLLRRRDSS